MEKIIQLQDLQPGTSYLIRARAINKFDVTSEWSQTFTLNVTSDDTQPSIPSAPTIEIAGPQKIVLSHDNTKDGGGDLEFDVVSYKVFENTVDDNTSGTLIHTMSATRPGSGISSFATINVDVKDTDPSATRYYYVTAVDAAGNESDPSPTATGVSITFFESAYISNLTADKIQTGTLQANQQISVGTVSPIVIRSNETSPRGQIYVGTTIDPTGISGSGFNDPNTAFYVDSTGKFSLKDKLVWDGNNLIISGYLQVGGALEPGDAADDVNNNTTTIIGDKIRTGNLISNNYISNTGSTTQQSTTFTNAGTWIDLDDGSIYSKNFYIDTQGSAIFKGNIFGSRGIFNGLLPVSEIPGLENPESARVPTVIIESTNTDDGYLVFFKNVGTDSGMEFYVKQQNGTNWRRGSLAHLDDVAGGFLRLGAFPSSTGITPGRIRIFAESTPDGKQGEIYLDARRTFAQKIFLTEPSTTGDWASDPVTNFWKDPDGVSNGSNYFKVGQDSGSAIEVRRTSSVTSKVKITDYEMGGINRIVENSKVTIQDISTGIDNIQIGRDVQGTGRHGFRINSNNYWTLNDGGNRAQFRVGGTNKYLLYDQLTDNLTLSGTISATAGTFGSISQGWNINSYYLSGPNAGISLAAFGFDNVGPGIIWGSPSQLEAGIFHNYNNNEILFQGSTNFVEKKNIAIVGGFAGFDGVQGTVRISGSTITITGNTTINGDLTVTGTGGGGGGTNFIAGRGLNLDTSTTPDTLDNIGYRNAGSNGGGTPPLTGNKITYSTGSPPTSGRSNGDLHFTYI